MHLTSMIFLQNTDDYFEFQNNSVILHAHSVRALLKSVTKTRDVTYTSLHLLTCF